MSMTSMPLPVRRRFGLAAAALVLAGCPDDGSSDGDAGGSESSTDPSSTTASTTTSPTTTTASTTEDTSGSTTDEPADSSDTSETMSSSTGEPVVCEVVPGAWDAPQWETNAADALALRMALDGLIGDPLMRGAETGTVMIDDVADLTAVWDGTPSLADAASPGFAAIVEQAFTEFVAIIAAGEQDLIDAGGNWAPGPDGGVWGDADRGINEGGLEVRQLVDKGGFVGVHYAYAVSLTEGTIEPATIDAISASWGSNAALDPMAMPADAASYSYQMGYHAQLATHLANAKAYAGDAACAAERDTELVAFFNLWEQSMYARLVFYGNRAAGKLLVAETDTAFADVLHDLGEGVGVVIGLHGMPDPAAGPLAGGARIIDDAQLEEALGALGVDVADLGMSTTGLLLESLPNLEAAIEDIGGVAMDAYGVDAATVTGWAMPTPG